MKDNEPTVWDNSRGSFVKQVSGPNTLEETPLWDIYEIIDGWYHEQTRHHLVDIDKKVLQDLLVKLGERERSLILSEAQRIGMEAIGEDYTREQYDTVSSFVNLVHMTKRDELRQEQRERLSKITGLTTGMSGKLEQERRRLNNLVEGSKEQ